MNSEEGFPYVGATFTDFDNPITPTFKNARILVPEHTARYFGDDMYDIISDDYSRIQKGS